MKLFETFGVCMSKRRRTTAIVISYCLLGWLSTSQGLDTFDGENLNRLYWQDFELIRAIENGEFISAIRVVDTTLASNTMPLADPVPQVSQFGTKVAITKLVNNGGSPQVRLLTELFNDGQGDTIATLSLVSGDDGSDVGGSAKLFRCGTVDCFDGETLLFSSGAFPRFDLTNPIEMSIDLTGSIVSFNLKNGILNKTVQVDVVNTLGLTVNPTVSPFAALGTADLEAEDRFENSQIYAAFDDVMLNGVLFDDFSSNELDGSKWRGDRLEILREISGGSLKSMVRSVGEIGNNMLDVPRPKAIDFIQTDVQVTSLQVNGARPRARISGFWYNADSQPGLGGQAGEVQAELRLIDRSEIGLGFVAEYSISRCNGFDCDTTTFGPFARPATWQPQVGQTHTISIERDDTNFEFCFDGSCQRAVSPFPNSKNSNFRFFKGVGTRVDLAGPGESASITARFDNVQTSKFPSFDDVSTQNGFFTDIEKLLASGVTGGCSTNPPLYCPDSSVTRGQMAAFMERALSGHFFVVPPASGTVFNDVPTSNSFASVIELFASDGITGGCSVAPPLYCPDTAIRRVEMVIFLLRAKFGSSFNPPAATGTLFADVGASDFGANFVEEAAKQGITGGCDAMNFCPNDPVTRGQMAAFIKRTFGL